MLSMRGLKGCVFRAVLQFLSKINPIYDVKVNLGNILSWKRNFTAHGMYIVH